ncbi:Acyl transferase/acyl hydrolase/lysophospholipase [Naviculisporaceae sp. PSN 640]
MSIPRVLQILASLPAFEFPELMPQSHTIITSGMAEAPSRTETLVPETTPPKRYLLSLDGGGVRGLSALLILRRIMRQVNHLRRVNDRYLELKPCDVFDLIGGTSTGGLIAIMLGRLEMDVESCLSAYTTFIPNVFKRRPRLVVPGRARYKSEDLEEAISNIVERRESSTDTTLDAAAGTRHGGVSTGTSDRGRKGVYCKVFVCVTPKERPTITQLLRSYDVPEDLRTVEPTIVQAAMATTAAPTFFTSMPIQRVWGGHRHYVDAAMGSNNPVKMVEKEAQNIWPGLRPRSQPERVCFVSLGTGILDVKALEDNLPSIGRALARIVTDTEKVAREFQDDWGDSPGYYRFNVEQGLQNMPIDDQHPEGLIDSATEDYLDLKRTMINKCAELLVDKQLDASHIVSLIETGNSFVEAGQKALESGEPMSGEKFRLAFEKFMAAKKRMMHCYDPDAIDQARFAAIQLGMAKALVGDAKVMLRQEPLKVATIARLLEGARKRIEDAKRPVCNVSGTTQYLLPEAEVNTDGMTLDDVKESIGRLSGEIAAFEYR